MRTEVFRYTGPQGYRAIHRAPPEDHLTTIPALSTGMIAEVWFTDSEYITIEMEMQGPTVRRFPLSRIVPYMHVELMHETLSLTPPPPTWVFLGSLEPFLLLGSKCDRLVDSHKLPGLVQLTTYSALFPIFNFQDNICLTADAGDKREYSLKIPGKDFLTLAARELLLPLDGAVLRFTFVGNYAPLYLVTALKHKNAFFPDLALPRPFFLGHRGCGSNRLHEASRVPIAENTPLSFKLAQQMGCIGSETDIILTSDAIPVICHNFDLRVVAAEGGENTIVLPLTKMNALNHAIASRTIRPLRNTRSSSAPHFRKVISREKDEYWVIGDIKAIYTLDEVLSARSDALFNLELKYPTRFSPYASIYFPRVRLVSEVLTVLDHHPNPIYFSSFDSILCVILKLVVGIPVKYRSFVLDPTALFGACCNDILLPEPSTKSPAIFMLYLSDEKTIEEYADVDLCSTTQLCHENALELVLAAGLTGMVLWRDILRTGVPPLATRVKDHGLMLITYGTPVDEKICEQLDMGVDGVIYDLCQRGVSKTPI
ncbi:Glycerophosphocholine phosphodiesterase [Giardia muris]|uniref:Glycerophosphocholine phosphodiesterase n=1 Tax=Giardia muris TaxID=5742 RepID=A0A4Z1SVQ9_GIAMU|nr:Glycerophosphocholine phosphodiesterase [Giardia muris]|eukprot:TNJ29942.1 Glycerophosphocholine phosphodiesterase [Giardia muris]